ncbi:MAG: type IX secretion system membrane protein PorP/SprF [Bacteroidota bacterium]|nr:type IX secretion system membrane protein PorP/SprF [Bacteroidota bacterium]
MIIPFIVFSLTVGIVCNNSITAQQEAQFSNFVANAIFYNPAVVGGKDCLELKSGYRNQWIGIDGAPRTTFLSFSTSVINPTRLFSESHIGLGGYFQDESFGSFKKTTFNLSYSYSFLIKPKVTFAFGIHAGIQQLGIDAGSIHLFQRNDPILDGSGKIVLVPDGGVGCFFENDDWYVGYSLKNMVMNNWQNLIISEDSRLNIHHFLMTGKRFYGKKLNFVPNLIVKHAGRSIPAADINFNFEYKNLLNVGVSYRNFDAFSALFHLNILDHINLYYAYDITTSNIQKMGSNTHEFIVSYKNCPNRIKGPSTCPLFY